MIEDNYDVNGQILGRVTECNDLGIKFNAQFCFCTDIQQRNFNGMTVSNTLCTLLVRSNLEYCSNVWSPYYLELNRHLEKVQGRFLRSLFPLNFSLSYEDMCKSLNIDSLHVSRLISSIMMCFVIVVNIDCPELLSQLNFNCSRISVRRFRIFKIRRYRTSFAYYEPNNEMMKNFNDVQHLFNFTLAHGKFKGEVTEFYRSR